MVDALQHTLGAFARHDVRAMTMRTTTTGGVSWGGRERSVKPVALFEELPCPLTLAGLRPDALAAVEALDQGAATDWSTYCAIVQTLVRVLDRAAPDRRGELLTTKQMADRLRITPKTLLKHKQRRTIRPAVERGKWIRWRGDERPG